MLSTGRYCPLAVIDERPEMIQSRGVTFNKNNEDTWLTANGVEALLTFSKARKFILTIGNEV